MNLGNFCLLDTETTGVGKKDQVLEISIISQDGDILFNSLVRPSVEISASARAVHGISDSEIENSPRWTDIVSEVGQILSGYDTILAYNSAFDKRIMDQTSEAYGIKPLPLTMTCAMKLICRMIGAASNLSLLACCNHLKIDHSEIIKHRSLGDCRLMQMALSKITQIKAESHPAEAKAIDNRQVILSPEASLRQRVRDSIDKALQKPTTLAEFESNLNNLGIYLAPVGANTDMKIKGLSFHVNGKVFSGTTLGRQYTAPKLLSRNLRYNPQRDYKDLERLFLSHTLRSQMAYADNILSKAKVEGSSPLIISAKRIKKAVSDRNVCRFSVDLNRTIEHEGIKALLTYKCSLNTNNKWAQTSLDTDTLTSLQLSSIAILGQQSTLKLNYTNVYDDKPSLVALGELVSMGNGCLGNAIKRIGGEWEVITKAALLGLADIVETKAQKTIHIADQINPITSLPLVIEDFSIKACTAKISTSLRYEAQ